MNLKLWEVITEERESDTGQRALVVREDRFGICIVR